MERAAGVRPGQLAPYPRRAVSHAEPQITVAVGIELTLLMGVGAARRGGLGGVGDGLEQSELEVGFLRHDRHVPVVEPERPHTGGVTGSEQADDLAGGHHADGIGMVRGIDDQQGVGISSRRRALRCSASVRQDGRDVGEVALPDQECVARRGRRRTSARDASSGHSDRGCSGEFQQRASPTGLFQLSPSAAIGERGEPSLQFAELRSQRCDLVIHLISPIRKGTSW